MNRWSRKVSLSVLGLIFAFGAWGALRSSMAARRSQPRASVAPATQARVLARYGKLPMSFEANRGQTDSRVKFLSRGRGYALFLTRTEAVLSLNKGQPGPKRRARHLESVSVSTEHAVLRVRLAGASNTPLISGAGKLPGKANYFIGNDPKKWHAGVPTYARVKYAGVYPGVDLVYYGNQGQLEYDFTVAPGANPKQIALTFTGAKRLHLDERGNLVIDVGGSRIVEHAPVVYQTIDGVRRPVEGSYTLKDSHTAGFKLAKYERDMPLVIDPVLTYSTYLGGSSYDTGLGIAVDSSGNAYVTGITTSVDFPTTAGAYQAGPGNGDSNAFVTKLNSSGGAVYSTFLGGTADDFGWRIAVDSEGNAYVTGSTQSTDFPTTAGAFQTAFVGGSTEAFVTKLDSAGSALVYSTFLGPKYYAFGDIAVDRSGNAYVTGFTGSSNFPTTPGAFQTTYAGGYDAFVTKLNSTGTALVYSTFLGGSGYEESHGIVVDSSGDAYIVGLTGSSDFPTTSGAFQDTFGGDRFDAFVTKLNSTGSALVYSTYLGGNGEDYGYGIAVDSSSNAYVTGFTYSSDFPTTPGAFQTNYNGGPGGNAPNAFVTKLDSTGAKSYSTYLGTGYSDVGNAIAVNSAGEALVTGYTNALNSFPTTTDALYATGVGAFLATLDSHGAALTFSTYLGGSSGGAGGAIALDSSGNAYITGSMYSSDFPTTTGALQSTYGGSNDAYAIKITFATDTTAPTISIISPTASTYTLNQLVPSAYTCTDADDTVTVCQGPVANGANIDTASIGAKIFTVDATDSHSNSTSLSVNYTVAYGICALYDQTHAVKSGATIPIKLQLCDSAGTDESSSSIAVHATGVVMISTSTSATLQDSGNANPDNDFRFSSELGTTGGYIFNLSTKGYDSGTYLLQFSAGDDPTVHTTQFEVK